MSRINGNGHNLADVSKVSNAGDSSPRASIDEMIDLNPELGGRCSNHIFQLLRLNGNIDRQLVLIT